jgi:hypothetical protein
MYLSSFNDCLSSALIHSLVPSLSRAHIHSAVGCFSL